MKEKNEKMKSWTDISVFSLLIKKKKALCVCACVRAYDLTDQAGAL